ncbi:Uncharacterised protein [Bordetella pertussis]|nr:Uncharacterised protein [Bordetella pertussis]
MPSDATPRTFWRPRVRSQIVNSGPTPAPAISMAPESRASLTAAPPDRRVHCTSMSTPACLPCFSISCWSRATLSSR